MIVMPENMNFAGKKFSMIISGSPGVGKTTLALSAPKPVIIDFDRGISRVKAQHRKAAIMPAAYEDVLADIESAAIKEYETIIVDTGGSFVTYLQDWAMRQNPTQNRQKSGGISLKGFGAVKAEFVNFTNKLKYILDKNVIYIFHTVEQKDGDITKQRLLCEGAARDIVWQPCDIGCFVQIVGNKRVAGFTPTEEYFAKGCYGVKGGREIPELDTGTPNDFLTRLFAEMHENIAAEAAIFEPEKKNYELAIEAGRDIIAAITDADMANYSVELLKTIPHALTSEKEIRAMFKKRVAEIGLKLDKETKRYVA